jgi:AraC-like DNA-binding protein
VNTLENSHLHYLSNDDGTLMPLDLRIDQCGHFPLTHAIARTHLTPPFNRLFLFTEGGFCDVTLDGHTHRLDAGRFWLIPLYRTFHVQYPACGHFFFVHFTAQAASGLDIFRQTHGIPCMPSAPMLTRRFSNAFSAHSPIDTLRFQALVLDVVARFADRPKILALWRENSLRTSYRAVLEHIREHNCHGLRIEELARLAAMTPDALRKGFRRAMGVPLKTYLLNDLRHRALTLLLGTDLNITQIAERLGYESPFYFERVFKRALREPPLRYRMKCREWIALQRHTDSGHPHDGTI